MVRGGTDAAAALAAVEGYLLRERAHNSLVLSLLAERAVSAEPGRYWWVEEGGDVAGLVFQSPLHFRALVAPAGPRVAELLAEAVAVDAPDLPGIMGEAATAAAFAGRWAECRAVAVTPVEGNRIYRLGVLRKPVGVPGRFRRAVEDDRDLLLGWTAAFMRDTGVNPFGPEELFERNLARGLWLWETDGPVSMAVASLPVAGMARIGFVYTPPEHRRRGYAAACVAALSERVVGAGLECLLNTQLQNPTSNAVYRRLGYEPVAELLIYRFG